MDNQITVLIVDDEEVGREALEGVLFTEGYQLIFGKKGLMPIKKRWNIPRM